MNTKSFTEAPATAESRPFTEFRAFTQNRNRAHTPATRSGIARNRGRCGCRTAGLRESAATAETCRECREAGTPCPADPFSARFGRPLPRGMRAAAAHMSWDEFTATFRPADGPLQLQSFTQHRADAAHRTITATVTIDGESHILEATGVGTISAMTSIVYAAGFPLEINAFHQQRAGGQIATFVECSRGYQRQWAMGLGATTAESIVDAFISAANRVSAHR